MSRSSTEDERGLAAALGRAMYDGGLVVADGRVRYANTTAEALFGAAPGELEGAQAGTLVAELEALAGAAELDELASAWLSERVDEEGEDDLVRLDGERFPARLCVTVLDEEAAAPHFAVTVQDVSERRALAAAMDAELVAFEERRLAALAANAEVIRELSLPVMSVWEGVLSVPLIGSLDRARAEDTTARLLEAVARESARVVIIDLTGLSAVDAASVDLLASIARVLGLIGTQCAIAGIGPQLAMAMVERDVDLAGSPCFATQKEALTFALGRLGWAVSKGGVE